MGGREGGREEGERGEKGEERVGEREGGREREGERKRGEWRQYKQGKLVYQHSLTNPILPLLLSFLPPTGVGKEESIGSGVEGK